MPRASLATTYTVPLRRHPGWSGVAMGVVLGITLTLGGLWLIERLGQISLSSPAVSSPAELMQAHLAREYSAEPVVLPGVTLQQHFVREHQADERRSVPSLIEQHFVREHKGDMPTP
jgi:hypothetical protein